MKKTAEQKSNEVTNEERYIGGYSSLVTKDILAKRTASVETGFFLLICVQG